MRETPSSGTLYLVPTPIGNLSDFSERARKTLTEVALIACEDTRVTRKLLGLFDIHNKLTSYHDHNEQQRTPALLETLKSGADVAIVTDAGSPGISDPAYRVIVAAIAAGVTIVPLPGPTSLIPALTGSGLPLDRFFFEGFVPRTSSTRKRRFRELVDFPHTLIFLESPKRLESTMRDALEIFGERPACIAREISKIHEEFIRGSLGALALVCNQRTLKGEIVLIVGGKIKIKRVKVNKYRPDNETE